MNKLSFMLIGLVLFFVSGCKEEPPKNLDLSWEKKSEDIYMAEFLHLGSVERQGDISEAEGIGIVFQKDFSKSSAFSQDVKSLLKQNFILYWVDSRMFLERLNKQEKKCTDVARPLVELLNIIRQEDALKELPVFLIGVEKGASLAYAATLQSQPKTFKALYNIGECPVLEYSHKLCDSKRLQKTLESGANRFAQPGGIVALWRQSKRNMEGLCKPKAADQFVKKVLQTDVFHFADENLFLSDEISKSFISTK